MKHLLTADAARHAYCHHGRLLGTGFICFSFFFDIFSLVVTYARLS